MTVACVAVLLALPAASRADTPGVDADRPAGDAQRHRLRGRRIDLRHGRCRGRRASDRGQPASTDRTRRSGAAPIADAPGAPSIAARPACGWPCLDSSPADPASVYVSIERPDRERTAILVERVDAATGSAIVLPPGRLQGIDAAGTAYLLSPIYRDYAEYTMIRCAAPAVTCDSAPTLRNLGDAIVDRKSVGLLVSAPPRHGRTTSNPARSGSATTAGRRGHRRDASGPDAGSGIRRPGPAHALQPQTRGQNRISVSHDAGLTWWPPHPVDPAGGVIVGALPRRRPARHRTYELISSTRERASARWSSRIRRQRSRSTRATAITW